MNLFTYAIASIVDVNTGHGLAGRKHFLDSDAALQRGREIRSKSAHGLLASIKSGIGRYLEKSRERAQERRDLRQLLAMNDSMLRDIGLSRGDLVAVEMGTVTLQELYAQRKSRSSVELDSAPVTTALDVRGDAVNQPDYDDRKCA